MASMDQRPPPPQQQPEQQQQAMLTAANLKNLESSMATYAYKDSYRPSCPSSASSSCTEDDNGSIFSVDSAVSSVSSVPEDEQAPFQVTDPSGVSVIVYSSLAQAARYSSIAAQAEQRQQQAGMQMPAAAQQQQQQVGMQMQVAAAQQVGVVPQEPQDASTSSYGYDDEDEDAYFSMG